MSVRGALVLLGLLLAVGALTEAVASAVHSSTAGSDRTVATPVLPGVRGMAPPATTAQPAVTSPAPAPAARSRAIGRPNHGRLAGGVMLAAEGADHTTWDAVEHASPNRDWRRVGTDRLVRTILDVAAAYRRDHPGAPRVVVSDLSLPEGGPFGPEYGGLGHASHQNGLDADIAYPRRDGREVGVDRVGEIDPELSQALVTAFVDAGAQFVFVGPRTGLRGPRAVVQPLANHDDHLHLRI